MPLLVTIIIPTWNGADRVTATLEALAVQKCQRNLFEVIIVDNCSDPPLRITEDHPGVALLKQTGIGCSVVVEHRQGLLYARLRGILEASSEIVCFLDDDNIPESDYVAEGIKAFSDASVGLLVSRVFPKYEESPPYSIARREHLLAINYKLGESTVDFGASATLAPTVGAGMWLLRQAFLQGVPWENPEDLLSDRKGAQLVSGGDVEIGYFIGKAGYRRVYVPTLRLWHLIPRRRVGTYYVCRLIIGIVRSEITLKKRHMAQKHTMMRKLEAISKMLLALLALPFLLLKRDGGRESLMVLISRYAQILGPYKKYQV